MSEKTYYLVESEEAKAKFKQVLEADNDSRQKLVKICKQLGGTGDFIQYSSGSSDEIQFAKDPGPAWKAVPDYEGFYRPLKNRKDGKEASKLLTNNRRPGLRGEICNVMLGQPFVFVGMALHTCGFETYPEGPVIITVKSESWKPIPGLRKLKNSEYWAMKEATESEAAE